MSLHDQQSHLVKRPTLVKTRVGCVKASTRELPPPDHTYGYSRPEDPEGAGEILSNWVTSNPSITKESEKMTVAQNILAIKNGCTTAKSMRQYGLDHPNIRMKESLSMNSNRDDNRASHEGPFGAKTKYSEDSMGDILQGKFIPTEVADYDYPDLSMIKKTGVMPKPKGTIASHSVLKARQKAAEEKEKKHFVMKKFQNIPGTYRFEDGVFKTT